MTNKKYINNKNILKDVLNEIQKEIDNESRNIEQLPDDMNYHLWCRRGLILAKQIVETNIEKETQQKQIS